MTGLARSGRKPGITMPIYNRTVAAITLRAALGRKRALLFAVPPLILVGVSSLLRFSHPADPAWPVRILGDFGFSVVLPLTALIIGTSVLGAEIEDGTIVHLLATPVPRRTIILTKFVIATVATMVFAAVPELVAGLIATGGTTRLAVGLFVGALLGAVIYNALFVCLSVATTRALALGLFYVLLWEGVLANFVGGARILSVGHYALALANAVARDPALKPGVNLTTAVAMGAIVTVLALAVAVRKLASFSLRGDAA
jgi:ABC-2 type transport system permease protein